jgi:hypothetical protein
MVSLLTRKDAHLGSILGAALFVENMATFLFGGSLLNEIFSEVSSEIFSGMSSY